LQAELATTKNKKYTPVSSSRQKTLTYQAENVHDFAGLPIRILL
jgi:hypothetical protein